MKHLSKRLNLHLDPNLCDYLENVAVALNSNSIPEILTTGEKLDMGIFHIKLYYFDPGKDHEGKHSLVNVLNFIILIPVKITKESTHL